MKTKLPEVSSVVQVGPGRGFVFDQKVRNLVWGEPAFKELNLGPFIKERRIITAAHCLPRFPAPHACENYDQVYPNLLGGLGEKPSVCGRLLFADPIADIAVLGSPDQQEMYEQAAAYDELVEVFKAIPIGEAQTGTGWMLSLDKPYHWVPTSLKVTDHGRLLSGPTLEGQSGSPILNAEGKAVGVVSVGSELVKDDKVVPGDTNGPQPMPKRNLPIWMLRP